MVVNKHVNPTDPYTNIPAGNVDKFLRQLMTGPVSIAIEADQDVFQHYKGGVIADDGSCGDSLDHAVLAVGHGTDESGTNFVLVKNSWGTVWGDKGFVKLGYGAGKDWWGTTTSACGFLNQAAIVHVK